MRKSALTVLAMVCLVGCGEVNDPIEPTLDLMKYISVSTGISTRVAETAFDVGDKISVYSYLGSATTELVVNNVINTCGNNNVWTPETPMKWKNSSDMHHFVATYPVTTITNFTKQSIVLENIVNDDLLLATADVSAGTGVMLSFDHVMSQVVVNILFNPASYPGNKPTITNVKLLSKREGDINFLTKKVTATGNGNEQIMNKITDINGYGMIVVPQIIASQTKMIEVLLDNTTKLTYTTPNTVVLEAGAIQTLDLTIGDGQIRLDGITIKPWTAKSSIAGELQ